MTALPASAAPALRTNSLALAFQEIFTVVLRTRFNVQRSGSAADMRMKVKRMIASATQNVRALGYSNDTAQMAIYAIVGFLDESVLSSKDPVFSDWARQTLQEELFGDNFEGERFFRRVAELLNRPESSEVADILELHCLCLQLGFRGRYAIGDASEIHAIIRRIRERIIRIRGPFVLARKVEAPTVPKAPTRDLWVRNLSLAAIVLAIVCSAAYLAFVFLLIQSTNSIGSASTSDTRPAITATIDQYPETCL